MDGRGEVGHVGRLSVRLHPLCHCLPRGNRPSNGKVVPHLHNHYHGDRKSFLETINVVLRDLIKNKKAEKKGLKCLKEDLVSQPDEQQRWRFYQKLQRQTVQMCFSVKHAEWIRSLPTQQTKFSRHQRGCFIILHLLAAALHIFYCFNTNKSLTSM